LSIASSINQALAPDCVTPKRSRAAVYLELTKARLSALVLTTTVVGFILAESVSVRWTLLAWTVVGTALIAGAANALNQCLEISRDARMERTRNRPLPSGAIGVLHAWTLAGLMGGTGVAVLAIRINLLTAGLGLVTLLIYVLIYTPLKSRTPLNTLVGAVCGALPPMMGWSAATGTLAGEAWILGAILFVWQIPHFLALAWLYRDDYARGGFRMLPVIDKSGQLTCCVMTVASVLLVVLAASAARFGLAGTGYAVGSLVLGGLLLVAVGQLCFRRTEGNARRVFLASIVYLPLLLVLMIAGRTPAA